MRSRCPRAALALLAFCAAFTPRPARADDWPQFRHDPSHSGVSTDKVALPLTEIWDWSSTGSPDRPSPLNAAIWRGRCFFVSRELKKRYLNCTDAKTGVMLWRRELTAPFIRDQVANSIGPAISGAGKLFVYDEQPVYQYARGQWSFNCSGNMAEIRALILADRGSLINLYRTAETFVGFPLPPEMVYAPRIAGPVEIRKTSTGVTFSHTSIVTRRGPGGQGGVNGRFEAYISFALTPAFVVRSFAADSGTPDEFRVLHDIWPVEPITRLTLFHPPLQHEARGVQLGTMMVLAEENLRWTRALSQNAANGTGVAAGVDGDARSAAGAAEGLGHPLVLGDEFVATSATDRIFRWTAGPQSRRDFPPNTQVVHPAPNRPVELSATARFNGYPPLLATAGVVVGDDRGFRFLTSAGNSGSPWHSDPVSTLGVAAARQGVAFMGVGGNGARAGISAVDTSTGKPLWTYPANSAPDASGSEFPGHWTNAGLAVTADAVYGEANGSVVALDPGTGQARWQHPLKAGQIVRSLAATPEHLLLCVSAGGRSLKPLWSLGQPGENTLLALNLEDGKTAWEAPVPKPGNLALAGGLAYFTDGDLHVYAPAERTFRVAVDSPRREDYAAAMPHADAADGDRKPDGEERVTRKERPGVADATVLRLTWGEPLPQMIAKVEARRRAVPTAPLLLSLDALNGDRSAWLASGGPAPLTREWITQYAETCRQLAAAAQPEHFEVLREADVYLARNPDAAQSLLELARAAVGAVHAGSAGTRVSVSFNCEMLTGGYAHGDYRRFGDLPRLKRQTLAAIVQLRAHSTRSG